jgi:hypothetical protein
MAFLEINLFLEKGKFVDEKDNHILSISESNLKDIKLSSRIS